MEKSQKKSLIKAEALKVFSSKGYSSAALHEVAAAAGVPRSSLYEHFSSKQELFLEVLREQTEAAVAYVGPRVTSAGSSETRMTRAVEAYFGYAKDNPAAWRLLFDRTREGEPEIQELRWAVRESAVEIIRTLLVPDLTRIGIDAESPAGPMVVEIIISVLDGATRWWQRHPETPRAELVAATVAMLRDGLSPAPA